MSDSIALQSQPLVSYVVLAYNQERFISHAVESALLQDYPFLEIILSDDCSSDGTFTIMREMVKDYEGPHHIVLRRNSLNQGLAAHINSALSVANGEIVTWAAGDDIALPQRTSVLVSALLSGDGYVASHSDVEEIDVEGIHLRFRRHSADDSDICIRKVLRTGQSIITQSCAFKKYVFDQYGEFRSDLTQEGIAMAFRIALLGQVAFVDSPLTRYRVGSGVSTYSGNDIPRLKRNEPIKVTKWYLSAYRQMLDDHHKASAIMPEHQVRLIRKKILFYSNLLNINTGKSVFVFLAKNCLLFPFDLRSVRACLRVILSERIYSILRC